MHKLYFKPARRYSEDIDLVQNEAGPIGAVLDRLQAVLNGFLGQPKRKQTEEGATVTYRMESEGPPVIRMRIKVEINTREHIAFQGLQPIPFTVTGRWFSGSCKITTFTLEEILATKLRALYQRRKGRDLFDVWLGLTEGGANALMIVTLFKKYMAAENQTIDSRTYEANMQDKMRHAGFLSDLKSLLPAKTKYDASEAFALLQRQIIEQL